MIPDGDPERPSIEPSQNGPYLVKNLETLRDSKGNTLPVRKVIALCRCGGSANKPFCDGTHAKAGFSEARESDDGKRENYIGKRITIHDNRAICAHAGLCTDNLASVFKLGEEPWIDADGDEAEQIIATIKQCPSGALSYTVESIEYRDQNRPCSILVSKDGPYHIAGGVELLKVPHPSQVSKEHYTLCRCGASKNKPFCDGSHWHVKFKDDNN